MGKWFGIIGYCITTETSPGIWEEQIIERQYYGDILKNYRSLINSSNVNDNIDISNQISIVADPFAYENFHAIRYVTFMDSKWKVKSVDVQYPRLIMSIGGIYNGGE